MSKVLCPRCQQAYVTKVCIVPLRYVVYLCEECDALWELTTAVQQNNYIDFGAYMQERGLTGDWALVKTVGCAEV